MSPCPPCRKVVCVDTEADFTSSAKRFDRDLAKAVAKKGEKTDEYEDGKGNAVKSDNPPRHVTFRLEADMDIGLLESRLASHFGDAEGDGFGVVGLHTCGDLGALLVKLFAESERAAYLQSVPCCYMIGGTLFPMSQHVRSAPWHSLSFSARELACHAIETYVERLLTDDQDVFDKLKVSQSSEIHMLV